ncbi:type II toxin-antitoxin system HipA family toxin, partial [Microbacterium gubbeenense]
PQVGRPAMRLQVELYGTPVGELEGEPRTFDFTPSTEAIEKFGDNSSVLSVAVPLTRRQRRDRAPRRRIWFEELLPEGDQYDHMLARAGLRRGDTLRFLARYGRDVAGALQVWDLDDPSEPRVPSAQPVSDTEIRQLLDDPIGAPLGNAPSTGRTSLGGVQPKIVLARTSEGWSQALGGFPSTHILKPQLDGGLASVIYDEEYGARVARRLGVMTYSTLIEDFDGLPTLVIERYDRHDGARIHQEDFNQALGASGIEKYQEYGGAVTLGRIAATLDAYAARPDVRLFARSLILAVAIGNLDMHAKNVSLLHPADGSTHLAPAYDIVPQAHRSDGRLALAIAKEYRHSAITRTHLVDEIASWGVRDATAYVTQALEEIDDIVTTEDPLDGAHADLHRDIRRFTRNLLESREVGA